MGLVKRARRWIRRANEARRFGLNTFLIRDLDVPESILVSGRRVVLVVPPEIGVRNDFISIFLDDCYGLRRTPLQEPVILDIGANVGLFAIAARAAFPRATIHAYEPNIELEPYLTRQAATGGFTYFLEAVGAEKGYVELEFRGDSNQTRSRTVSNGVVRQESFAKVIERAGGKVDFAKIDCEGAEWQLFENAEPWTRIDNLAMEYHLWAMAESTHDDVIGIIQRLGFEIIENEVAADDYGLLRARRVPSGSGPSSRLYYGEHHNARG